MIHLSPIVLSSISGHWFSLGASLLVRKAKFTRVDFNQVVAANLHRLCGISAQDRDTLFYDRLLADADDAVWRRDDAAFWMNHASFAFGVMISVLTNWPCSET